jgi:hypothetical protein
VDHDEAAIEELAHLDGEPGEGAPAAELHEPRAEADSVVARHDATVAAPEDEGEIARRAAPDGRRLRGRFAEAPIEVRDEFRQVGLGRLDRANVTQAQFADEPILQGGPQPLDAAFGLGRACADITDGERVQDAAEIRRRCTPASCSSTDQWASLRTRRFKRSPYTASGTPCRVKTSRKRQA